MTEEYKQPTQRKALTERLDIHFALKAARLGVWELDPITNVVNWDDRCRELFGLATDNLLSYEQAIRHIHPDDVIRVDEAVRWAMNPQSGGDYDIIYRTIGADDGLLRWVRFVGQASFNKIGAVLRFAGIAQDVTKDVQTQQHEVREERFRNIIEQTPAATLVLRGDDCVVEQANRSMIDLIGQGKEVIGKPLLALMPELEHEFAWQQVKKVYQEGISFDGVEVPVTHSTAGVIKDHYYNLAYRPLKEDERITGVIQVVTEVTDQVVARKKVEESEARFRNLIEEAPVATCLFVGRELVIDIANEAMINIWGKGWSVIGQSLAKALPELEGQPYLPLLNELFTTGKTYESKADRADLVIEGTLHTYYFDYSFKPLRNAVGEVYAIMEMAVDVTEQVIARQKLEASETYLRQLTDTVPVMIWLTEPDGYCSYLNRPWYDYTGQTEAESEGFGWLDATHPNDKAEAERLFVEANRQQTPFNALYRLRQKDGTYRWSIDKASPRFSADGTYEGMIGTVVDVHDQKLAEEGTRTLIALMETSREFIGMAAPDTTIQYGNPAALTMLGWDTVAGKTILDCVYPDDRALAERIIPELLEKGLSSHEIRFVNAKTGEPFWLQWDAVTVKEATSGKIISLGTISPNVTERRKAEQALAQSEVLFRTIVEQAPMAIGLLRGRDMVIEVGNNKIFEVWGKAPSITGLRLIEALPEIEGQGFIELLEGVYDTGEPFFGNGILANLIRNGRQEDVFFDFTYTPLQDTTGTITGVMVLATEVTEQVRSRKAVEASEAKLRSVVATAPAAIGLFVGRELIVELPNQAFIDIVGKGPDIVGKPLREVMPELDSQPFLQILDDVYTSGKMFQSFAAQVNIVQQGVMTHNFYNITYTPLFDSEGAVYAILDMAIDVTETVKAQQKLEESENRFRTLSTELDEQVQMRTQQLQTSVQDLERSNQNLQQFAYIASHDLQEPLRKIQSFGDILHSQYANQLGEGVDYLQRMQSAASRMSVLIKDLLTFSRISTQQDDTTPVSLTEVVQAVMNDLDLVITETGARLDVKPLPTVQGDKSQLGQLFQNLLSNALKFRRSGQPGDPATPVIRISSQYVTATNLPPSVKPTRAAAAYHRLDVTDNGIGFEEKYAKRIFQVFQRLHGKNEFAGTGIGLAICEKVVANHGGAIAATSQPGQGATFSVYLPV